MKIGDLVRYVRAIPEEAHLVFERRNGRFAGLTGLIVGERHAHRSHQVLLETAELVSLHITQIGEVINESR